MSKKREYVQLHMEESDLGVLDLDKEKELRSNLVKDFSSNSLQRLNDMSKSFSNN